MAKNKPLPLLPDEERKLYPRGLPIHPREVINSSVDAGRRGRIWIMLFGGKSQALINNYWKMKKSGAAIFLLIVYFALFIAWFPSFGFAFLLIQRLLTLGETNIPVLVVCVLVVLVLPLFPRIIAWVQEEHFEAWKKEQERVRSAFLARPKP